MAELSNTSISDNLNTFVSSVFSVSGKRWNFCPDCGQKLEESWKHCPGCGQAIGALAAPQIAQAWCGDPLPGWQTASASIGNCSTSS